MAEPKNKETGPKGKPKNWAIWFKRIGWVLGFGFSLLLPQLTAPLGATLPFKLVGCLSAITGFGLAYSLTPRLSIGWKILWTVLPVIGAGVSGGMYRSLLLPPEHSTPTAAVEWGEFGLFCIAYFCVFAVIGSAYRNGGAFLVQKFAKITIPAN